MLSDEESKAIQEIAKAAGTSVEAVKDFSGFIARCIDGPLEQVIGIWNDKLKYRRWKNQVILVQKARGFLRERGISGSTRTLDLSVAIPLLEEAAMADSEPLQERWAALLANAADPSQPEVRRAYVSILAEMTPSDAEVLDRLFDVDKAYVPTTERPYAEIWTADLPNRLSVGPAEGEIRTGKIRPDIELTLVNLGRLGLLDSTAAFGGMAVMHWVSLTELGRQFVSACRRVGAIHITPG